MCRLIGVLVGWALSTVTKHKIHIGHVTLVSINDVAVVSRDGKVKLTVKHVSLVSKLFHSNAMLVLFITLQSRVRTVCYFSLVTYYVSTTWN